MPQRSKSIRARATAVSTLERPPRMPKMALPEPSPALVLTPELCSSGTLGGSAVGPREIAARGELGGHSSSAVPPSSTHHHQPNNAMSEKTTKTIETADVPGHDKKVETHTEEIRHQPETKVETKTEATEKNPE